MSQALRLLDLRGTVWRLPEGGIGLRLPDALSGPTILVTDYETAPFGVATLPAAHGNLAPVLEKHLRDEGDIDGLARVIVHASERQGELARVCYTAIPVATWLRYRQWASRHGDYLLTFPLLEALLALVRRRRWQAGLLAFVHDDSVDVLMIRDGGPVQASRQRLFGGDEGNYARVAGQLAEWHEALLASAGQPACLLLERTDGEGRALAAALLERGIALTEPPLPVAELFQAPGWSKADLPPLERSFYLSRLALPWVAAAMLAACLVALGVSLYWKHEAQALQARLETVPTEHLAGTRHMLEAALRDADALGRSQRERADFVHLAELLRRTPDPATLVRHMRQAVPSGIALTETGIVTDEQGGVLIVVAGRSESIAAPFAAEERFVKALHGLGYRVVRREIEGGIGNSLFRLALTWSEE